LRALLRQLIDQGAVALPDQWMIERMDEGAARGVGELERRGVRLVPDFANGVHFRAERHDAPADELGSDGRNDHGNGNAQSLAGPGHRIAGVAGGRAYETAGAEHGMVLAQAADATQFEGASRLQAIEFQADAAAVDLCIEQRSDDMQRPRESIGRSG